MSWLIIAKVAAIFALARIALWFMRRASAALRHVVIVIALLAAVLIPALETALPAWEVLPRPAPSLPVADTGSLRQATVSAAAVPMSRATAGVPVEVRSSIDWRKWLPVAWLTGVGGLMLLLLFRLAAMAASVRRARRLTDPGWNAMLEEIRAEFGIRARVEIRVREAGRMPAVWGVRRPVVLLPADCLNWGGARRRDVLAHELAHVLRHDVAALILGHIACALHWFNPLAWILRGRLAVEAELACDDLALAQGAPASRYADHLLITAAKYANHHSLAPVMAARSQLEGRIMAIMDRNRNRNAASQNAKAIVIALASLVLVPLSSLTWGQAKDMWEGTPMELHQHVESHSAQFAGHLRRIGIDADDADALLAALSAADALTRAASAWALGDIEEQRVIDPLIQAGYDEDAVVRQWAIRSLAPWKAQRIAYMLVDRLQDGDAEVRQWATRVLGRHDDSVRTQPLINALDDADAAVREWAVRVLAEADDPRVAPAMASRVAVEPDAAVAEWLVRSLGGNEDAASIEALLGALNSDSTEVRQWAVRGLAGSRNDRTVDALVGMLRDSDDEVREWSARGLGFCGNDRAIAPLQAMSRDTSESVREWAGRALAQIDC